MYVVIILFLGLNLIGGVNLKVVKENYFIFVMMVEFEV